MPTTTIGTFHSSATSTGNGSSIAVPSGDIVILVSVAGSGPIGAVIQPQVSADNSTWVDLQPSTRISGAASIAQMVDVATTAAYIRVVLSEISGINAAATVQLATYYPTVEVTPTLYPSGNVQFPGPVVAPGDGGVQGGFLGTFANVAAAQAAKPNAAPGSFATGRDGTIFVAKEIV